MHQAGLRDPTHPSKEYLLVLGMSMMSMKPRFPAGSRWGMEGRWLPHQRLGAWAGPGPSRAWASTQVLQEPLLPLTSPHITALAHLLSQPLWL